MDINKLHILENDIYNECTENKIKNVEQELKVEQEITLSIKKKKGRKSKKDKLLELELLEKNKVPIKLFPNLNEKIFDVIKIKEKEYFFDTDFCILYDENINQVGFKKDKKDNKYIMYDELDLEINKINECIKLNDEEIFQII